MNDMIIGNVPEAFIKEVNGILSVSEFLELGKYRHHHHTDRLTHSISVSYLAWKLACRFGCDEKAAARAGMLHDFCPYDFGKRTPTGEHQAFYHPKAAVENSRRVFGISKKEEEIIMTHMFPLSPIPGCREGWIVVLADKICTIAEYCGVSITPSAAC